MDQAGRDFIKQFEGFRGIPYKDIHGIWTIGYGHIEGVTADTPPITEEKADALFQTDLAPTEKYVTERVRVALTQNQFNALVSFAFNEGIGKLGSSTLLEKVNQGDMQAASREFDRWVFYRDAATGEPKRSEGLTRRRAAERELFLSVSQTG